MARAAPMYPAHDGPYGRDPAAGASAPTAVPPPLDRWTLASEEDMKRAAATGVQLERVANGETGGVTSADGSTHTVKVTPLPVCTRLSRACGEVFVGTGKSRLHTAATLSAVLCATVFILGACYTIGRTVQWQFNNKDLVDFAHVQLPNARSQRATLRTLATLTLELHRGVNATGLAADGTPIYGDALINALASELGYPGDATTASAVSSDRCLVQLSATLLESSLGITNESTINIGAGAFCAPALLTAILRFLVARRDADLSSRIMAVHGRLSVTLPWLDDLSVRTEDVPAWSVMLGGLVGMAMGYMLLVNGFVSAGLALAACGAVSIALGVVAYVNTMRTVTRWALRLVENSVTHANKQRPGLVTPAITLRLKSIRSQLDKVPTNSS